MPQEFTDIKKFIELCRRKDASAVRIKRNPKTGEVKFKARASRRLATLKVKDPDKADKLKQSLPPGALPAWDLREPTKQFPLRVLHIAETPKKNKKGKRTA